MRFWRFPASAWILTLIASWLAGTATRASALLAQGLEFKQLISLLSYFQQVDVPLAIWASLPLCLFALWLEDRPFARTVALLVTAALTAAGSAFFIAYSSWPDPFETGNGAAVVLSETPTLIAFHVVPLIVVLVAFTVRDRARSS